MTADLDSPTIAARAATPTSPDPGLLPEPLADALASSPGLVAPPPREWMTGNMTPLAAILHSGCDCAWGGDVEGHGLDFEDLAHRVREGILAESVDARHPVEAKVWAGTWGTLGATIGLALVTLLLDRLDVVGSLFGGESPAVGVLVLVLGVMLPPVASFLRGWLAVHTARPADELAVPSSPEER